jgi:hypothetical protein
VANEKYDNLTTLMTTGWFDWVADVIQAILTTGATFTASDTDFEHLATPNLGLAPVGGRVKGEDGSLQGFAVSFNAVEADIPLQVVLVRNEGSGVHTLLAWYDEDDTGGLLQLTNHGTFILRPPQIPDPNPTALGVWVSF